MPRPLGALIVEDSEDDAILLVRELRRGGYTVASERVDTAAAMRAALCSREWDLVIADYQMPHFSGLAALEMLKDSGLDLPFIIVSGAIGEDLAVEAMRRGAHDYMMKGRLARLVPAVERELREADVRRQRRKAEEAQAQLQEQLHQAQKMEAVGQLAAGLGHDFGNLLTMIQACVWRARTSLHDAQAAGKALDAVEDAARQAGGIVQSLLTFSCRAKPGRQPVNLCAIMDESAYLLRHTLPSMVKIASNPGDQPMWINGDPVQVEQVLLNLGINARDAMPNGGTLELSLAPASRAEVGRLPSAREDHPRFARLVVRDTGTGIPPEIRPRIFEPYFTTKARGQGAGLGLSIVHGIVQDLGGRIDVRSQSGEGTSFTILLPCIEPPAEPVEQTTPDLAIKGTQGQTVLVVDRNPHSRGIMGATLRLLGCEVMQAADEPAMEAYCDELRDRLRLIVVDADTCERPRARFVDRIRGLGIAAPVVITGDQAAPGMEEEQGMEANVFLLRCPFGMPELSETVCRALGITDQGPVT